MNKYLKWTLISIAGLAVLLFVAFKVLQSQTKKHSPEQTVTFAQADTEISVFYNRPFKKERVVFGELVPYGEVWRTGANEATTFTTNKDLRFGNQTLPAGAYTLWTIPGPEEWTIIFNNKQYGWGVGFDGKASRDPEADVLQVKAPVTPLNQTVEQFTISFDEGMEKALVLAWDRTRVRAPFRD